MSNLLSVLNAADRIGLIEENFQRLDGSLAFMALPTKVAGVATTIKGAPTAGTFVTGFVWVDALLARFRCTAGGTPGSWQQEQPAYVAALPEDVPDGYRVFLPEEVRREYVWSEGDEEWKPVVIPDVVDLEAGTEIDWAAGNVFTKEMDGDVTFTFANARSGQTIIVRVAVVAEGGFAVYWPAEVVWNTGEAPAASMAAADEVRTDIYTLVKVGDRVYASAIQNFNDTPA